MAVFASRGMLLDWEAAHLVRRENSSGTPTQTVAPDATNQPASSPAPVTHIPISTKALAVIVAWRIRVWLNRRKARTSPSSQFNTSAMEKGYSEKALAFGSDNYDWITAASYAKPRQPVLVPIIPTDSSVRWQPQIRSVASSDIPPPVNHDLVSPPAPVKQVSVARYSHKHDSSQTTSSLSKHPFAQNFDSKEDNAISPPVYRSLPIPPPPPETSLPDVPPPTPPASITSQHKYKKSISRSTITHISLPPTSFDIPPIPTAGPDTPNTPGNRRDSLTPGTGTFRNSQTHRQPTSMTTISDILSPLSASGQQLPRLMVVASTFTPARDDEILVKTDETLRLLEEYADGWCLVQRVGKPDAEKGCMPRFCLQERPKVLKPPKLMSTFSFHGARSK